MTEPRTPSLRRNLLLRLWLPLLLLLLASAVSAYALARHYAEKVYDRWLWDSAMSLATLLRVDGGQARLDLPPAMARMFEWDSVDQVHAEVVSPRHGRLYGDAGFPLPPPATSPGQVRYYDAQIDRQAVRIVAIDTPLSGADDAFVTVQVAETGHKRRALAGQLLLASVPLQALVLLLAGALVWYAVGAAMRALDEATQRLTRYDPKRLLPIAESATNPLEIRPLALALNDLILRLADAQQAQQRFVANAAHQLRTPLAALQVQAERALRETDPTRHREALAHVLSAVTRLRHLTHQILTLSRSEAAAQGALSMRALDLAELARDELEQHADRALALGVDLGYDGPEHGVSVVGDAQLLRELIANLVDNALLHGRHAGGSVVTLGLDAEPPCLRVDDDGPGIAPADRELVFERFHRGSDSRGEGCGLGLSIALEIAARHGTSLAIVDPPHGRGTRVRVCFPPHPTRPVGSA